MFSFSSQYSKKDSPCICLTTMNIFTNLMCFLQNVDLMSLIHEQDADLGVDWRSFSGQIKKNGKNVDNDFDNWPKKV